MSITRPPPLERSDKGGGRVAPEIMGLVLDIF